VFAFDHDKRPIAESSSDSWNKWKQPLTARTKSPEDSSSAAGSRYSMDDAAGEPCMAKQMLFDEVGPWVDRRNKHPFSKPTEYGAG